MAEGVRILVAHTDANQRRSLVSLITSTAGLLVAGELDDGVGCAEVAQQARVQAVLLSTDLAFGDDNLTGTLAAQGQTVIVVGAAADTETMRRALTSGASDFLTWPISANSLVQALRDVGLAAGTTGSSPVCIIGARGGVGKSVVALNLAIAAARRDGQPSVVADLDLDSGTQAMYCGQQTQATVGDLIRLDHAIDSDALRNIATHVPGIPLALLASPTEPGAWSAVSHTSLALCVERIGLSFPRVVVDLPPAFDERTVAVMEKAARTILVTTAELPALYHTARLLRLMHDSGLDTSEIVVVCNRTHPKMRLGNGAVQQALGSANVWHVPFDEHLAASVNAGQPLLSRRGNFAFARAMTQLAGVVWPDADEPTAQPAPERRRASARRTRMRPRIASRGEGLMRHAGS